MGDLLTVTEAATRLTISTCAVRKLVAAGHLPCYRLGVHRGAIRLSASDLDDYLRRSRAGGTQAALRHIRVAPRDRAVLEEFSGFVAQMKAKVAAKKGD